MRPVPKDPDDSRDVAQPWWPLAGVEARLCALRARMSLEHSARFGWLSSKNAAPTALVLPVSIGVGLVGVVVLGAIAGRPLLPSFLVTALPARYVVEFWWWRTRGRPRATA
jgi:hypothetical protein